ncbi:methylmalonyl-CoA carboxyltransferase [Acidiferrimicrobium sp. IK]|uniref:acyl-CoA carboxylase subunit beta n=1 Tax=Acidiferrimicrobium sp. IK TaxID=2871700 RepID=UPI0021CAFC8F|nr:carboxyl transferase domain-containing protein [Acidiferrimicrobium sp. IK]MCU4183137.1 methylmalonyl-CoA carboxyltransferase [Acidiferrimicrobium sp. IK]
MALSRRSAAASWVGTGSFDPSPHPAEVSRQRWLPLRGGVPGSTTAGIERLALTGRRVVLVRTDPAHHLGALSPEDSATLAAGARVALDQRLPLVMILSSSGADIHEGVAALHGWGTAALAVSRCSGMVPVMAVVDGLAVSGPALLLGMADVTVMTASAVAYVSGPAAVAELTGLRLGADALGGASVHGRSTGVAALSAASLDAALDRVAEVLDYLPDHSDEMAERWPTDEPADRPAPELRDLIPPASTGSYDVRRVIAELSDDGDLLELRAQWAPQLVTALTRIDGRPVGVVANQPQSMAGTLDIAASQKGARFVAFCDAFNVALLTLVDTPGFMPGKDLEWRGMIRHGAQLVHSYAEATVPRVCLVLRKAFGGAYIVMDSKLMGNDLCLAWPSAQIAVMGAQGAVQILHRREPPEVQRRLVEDYEETYLNPYVAAERGFVDRVIDPIDTRFEVVRALRMLDSKRERIPHRKHGNGPL